MFQLRIDPRAPLVIVDVDEVLALFMRAFEAFVVLHGYEMRIDKFALFQNIYRCGESQPLDTAAGRRLFDAFFELERHEIDVAEGAREALAQLAKNASVVILTNAPAAGRPARAKWLIENGLPYGLVVSSGPKGKPVAALAKRTIGRVAFVDDLLPNLDSVAEEAPAVHRFQTVADERLRALAPSDPARHARIDDWGPLSEAIASALRI
jgi:FMN phosphatase YigB (HAD superfamily)